VKAALSEALGVSAVVFKKRHLLLWEGVRIHLDEIDGLGDFIEFEAAVQSGATLRRGEERVRFLRQAFQIADVDLVGQSYCDLAPSRQAGAQ
jgi:adenylate cyclase class 2